MTYSLTFASSIFITLLFFLSGFHKIKDFKNVTKDFMKKTNLPLFLSQVIIIGVILLEIIAPFIISLSAITAIQKIYTQLAILALIGFTILATLLYHFPPSAGNYYSFMSNLSTIGGLMLLYKLYTV